MSEEKKCPLLRQKETYPDQRQPFPFLECIKDECAWWVYDTWWVYGTFGDKQLHSGKCAVLWLAIFNGRK